MSSRGAPPEAGGRYWKLYLIIAVGALFVFAVLKYLDALEYVYRISLSHADWHLNDLFALIVAAALAAIAVLVVHEWQLRMAITQRDQAEALAREASRYDGLTGISNRALFQEDFARALARARASGTRLAVLVIDVDAFQQVNDVHGHAAGDAVLTTLAKRIRAMLRQEETLARLGADEFVALSPLVDESTDELFRLAERILKVAHEEIAAPNRRVQVSASIGIAKYPRDGDCEADLLRRAETALTQAKSAGKDRYALYDSTLDAHRRERLDTEVELREGLERGEIVALYQPLVDLQTLRPRGFEALARWHHPTRGLLGAPAFIPIVEDAGLVGRLLTAMLERVCADSRDWPADLSVAVNLSPPQLLDPDLTDTLLSLLARMGVAASRIELEITETALLQDFDTARRTMSALREAGVRMSLDDFGTGFSSLRHLQELPIDKIKIDQSFTRRLTDDADCRKIVSSMLSLAAALGLTTVAEGVESQAEAEWLRGHGCTLGQGYLFARPMPAAAARQVAQDAASGAPFCRA
ncbi:putative bifunctional diguanylate cyclase/phosphodiesterase [Xanthobacter agilis]|uniref:Diguanylate cyclase (GGDEF)-like protein n=1 Tax=Xanthobacter agilis TaxID=47492 RepID=A0ABU0LGV2_XANAG|nr:EAL domain-containing protein [Xanthobacter agilis]MDQ0506354.1 diguanylate cyclase (GGDEF)-like protein [Xanthobacter agilis]